MNIAILLGLVVVMVWRTIDHVTALYVATVREVPIDGDLIGRVVLCVVYTILSLCIIAVTFLE